MSGLSVLSGKFYLYIYLPIYHIIYHCHFSSICVFMYIIYIYVCKYSMLHINMFLYYLLYKVGYFTKQKFHDVHLWLLWRPSSRSIYACSSSFLSASLVLCQNYETSTYNVPRAPLKKTMQSLNIENWFLISIPLKNMLLTSPKSGWKKNENHEPNNILLFVVQSFVLAGGIFKSYWGLVQTGDFEIRRIQN